MPGYLLHQGATVLCMHGGNAMPTSPNPRVKLSGQPVTLQPIPYSVAGCPFTTSSPQPCVIASWVSASARVKVMGMPVLLQDSQAICTPNGTGVNIVATQVRVKAI